MYKCRICGGKDYVTILSGYRSRLGEVYSLKQCKACSFVSTDPLPTAENLKQYYGQDYWQKGDGRTGNLLALLYKIRMFNIIREIKKLVPRNGRILEWGAGDGALVKLLNQTGFECWGIDLYSVKPNNKRLISATIEEADFLNKFFDAITCFHVLEHINRPVSSLKKAFSLLKVGGILIVEVPNIASLGFNLFKKNWQPLEIPTHLNHFTLKSLQELFKIIGNANVIEVGFFSHRASPSGLVLSLFPFFSPKQVRQKHHGKYPFPFMAIYLTLQIFTYPFAILESSLRRGSIIRIYVKKISQ